MKTYKLYLLLILSLSLLILLSCGDSDSAGSNESNARSSDTPQADIAGNQQPEKTETQEDLYTDDLPAFDYKGAKFTMLTFNDYPVTHADLVIDEQTGDIVEDSIYLSNRIVQDRFGLEFEQLESKRESMPVMLKKAVNSGDYSYDFVLINDRDAMDLAMQGRYFYTMNELPHVNLDKLYWDQRLKKDMTIGNVLYFTYGANMLSAYDLVNVLVFNKKMTEELGLENMYELVRNGKWTIDKMHEMAAEATVDINGDGKMTDADQYGVLIQPGWHYPPFWVSERIPLVAKDENDLPYFNVPGNEKLFAIFNKVYDYAQTGIELVAPPGTLLESFPAFEEGRGLIMNATMFTLQYLRVMEIDYGVLPYPSLYEKSPGEPYSSRLALGIPLVVPVTADPERASVVLEALACEYQRRVIPSYYDIAVQIKATRDEDSVEMIKMMMDNRFVDLGDTIWYSSVRVNYEGIFKSGKNTFQSVTDRIAPKVESLLEKAIEAFQNAGG